MMRDKIEVSLGEADMLLAELSVIPLPYKYAVVVLPVVHLFFQRRFAEPIEFIQGPTEVDRLPTIPTTQESVAANVNHNSV